MAAIPASRDIVDGGSTSGHFVGFGSQPLRALDARNVPRNLLPGRTWKPIRPTSRFADTSECPE